MDNTAIYRNAFAPYQSVLIEQGTARIRRIYAEVSALYPGDVHRAYNNWSYAKMWRETVAPCTRRLGSSMRDPVILDESRLSDFVANWADSELDSAVEKLALKVGTLDNVTLAYASGNGDWFTVCGTRANGDIVRIVQNQTINVSSRGKLFNQWPALIYVNGKKVSEVQYKRL